MPRITITSKQEPLVVAILDTWQGKLSWDMVVEKVKQSLDVPDTLTRQTLSSRADIKDAFTKAKERLKKQKMSLESKSFSVTHDALYYQNQIRKLEVELEREKEKVARYEARFVRWQYNAYINGIPMHSLDNPEMDDVLKKEAVKDEATLDLLDRPLSALNRQHRTI